jgi:hypothetical protein
MKRTIIREPPRTEEIIFPFSSVDQVEAFLFRRLARSSLPYLEVPYIIYGTIDLEPDSPADRPVQHTVLSHPRVYVLPCVGELGFQLRVEVPRVAEVEEVEPDRWRIEEDYEFVQAEQFRVRRIERALHGSFDGFEELRIDHRPTREVLIVGDDRWDEALIAAQAGVPVGELGEVVPVRWSWLRISLEDPGKHRTEMREDEHFALVALAAL